MIPVYRNYFIALVVTTTTFIFLVKVISQRLMPSLQINQRGIEQLSVLQINQTSSKPLSVVQINQTHSEQSSVCQIGNNKSSSIDLLIFIASSHQAFTARHAIRSSYALSSKNNTSNVRYIFIFGQSKDKMLNTMIKEEKKKYNDIYQDTFIDTYDNLTLKTLSGFKWVTKYCSHAKYFMKADVDVWVNVPKILIYLYKHGGNLKHSIGGGVMYNTKPIRDSKHKWYTPKIAYSKDRFPDYCSGPAYITTINVAKDILTISQKVPYFRFEDVYLGMCLKKLGYRVTAVPGFVFYRATGDVCKLKRDFLTSHLISPNEIIAAWNSKC